MATGSGTATDGDPAGDIFMDVPGGAAMIHYFGRVPDFDGPNILKFSMDRDRYSTLNVHGWVPAGCAERDATPSPERHAAVSFVLSEIIVVQLNGLYDGSQIGRLVLRRVSASPERGPRTSPFPSPNDIEIELSTRSGSHLLGLIRARSVEIELTPGKPDRGFRYSGKFWMPNLVIRALADAWDPYDRYNEGLRSVYDCYVQEFVELVQDTTVDEKALVAHLARIEIDAMGLSLPPTKRVRGARALLGLRDAGRPGADRLIKQWCNRDGSSCVRIIETRDGQYAHEQRIYRSSVGGGQSYWEDVGTGRSGLFATFEAAAREAHYLVGWMRVDAYPPCP